MRASPLPKATWAFGRGTELSKSRWRGLTRRSWLCRSPAASEPRSNKEPRACRPGTPLRIHAPVGATLKRPRLRVLFWPYPSRHPQRKPLRVPPIWRRQSAISLPGFSHPGGATSSAWLRGLLRRPPSAARTTEQGPISGQGLLPCVVQLPKRSVQSDRSYRSLSSHRQNRTPKTLPLFSPPTTWPESL